MVVPSDGGTLWRGWHSLFPVPEFCAALRGMQRWHGKEPRCLPEPPWPVPGLRSPSSGPVPPPTARPGNALPAAGGSGAARTSAPEPGVPAATVPGLEGWSGAGRRQGAGSPLENERGSSGEGRGLLCPGMGMGRCHISHCRWKGVRTPRPRFPPPAPQTRPRQPGRRGSRDAAAALGMHGDASCLSKGSAQRKERHHHQTQLLP